MSPPPDVPHVELDAVDEQVHAVPRRTVRISDDVWLPAQAAAEERGESVSDVLRRALIAYVDDESQNAE